MLYGFLITLFALLCLVLIFLILMQKSKSSMGLGSMGGGSQMLFGGSGGQDFFQKLTWALGMIFMFGSLGLAIMRKPTETRYIQAFKQQEAAKEAQENKAAK